MGTWGYGHFDNDGALDFMDDLEISGAPYDLMQQSISDVIEADYIDSDDAVAAIVSAAYVDRQVNGTRFTPANSEDIMAVDTFPERFPLLDLRPLKADASAALRKIVTDGSELYELWQESDEAENWLGEMAQLIMRLEK